jgi:ParB family transcriptional regulator, chromosome partitioning protein
MAKPALGKGLGALIGKSAGSAPAGNIAPFSPQPKPGEVVRNVAHGEIIPSTLQPRKEFAKEQLSELMESIRSVGIMQPLIVRARNGKLELIAGERRWRASGELGLKEIPVIVREASDKEVLEMALIENLQREGLNPIEEAHAYARLSKEFNLRQEDIAQRVGKNRATVANAIRLLDLPSSVQSRVREGKLSTGHAKVLLSLKNPADIEGAAAEIIAKAMTVRACEKLVDSILRPPQPKPKPSSPDAQLANALKEVQKRLTSHLATAVQLHHGEKKGRIEIEYYGVDDLNRLLGMMGLQEEDFGG